MSFITSRIQMPSYYLIEGQTPTNQCPSKACHSDLLSTSATCINMQDNNSPTLNQVIISASLVILKLQAKTFLLVIRATGRSKLFPHGKKRQVTENTRLSETELSKD